ncbi:MULTISPECIES: hypothetical protein [Acinetobacter]|uniref:hypothetical protein n=1 Tax=Acinetobacter TaxID=469 RepID=UPI0004F50E94|nr:MULTISPECIES: hypothetical protein [Acinetobacter]MCO9048781.1 hypothetical protein [Acinetobacter sp. UC24323]
MKIRPIRFSDTRNHTKNSVADDVTERYSTFLYDSAAHGKSYYMVRCAFCKDDFKAFKWSLRGGGKRCPNCKAIMGSNGQTYQWSSLVKDKP